MIRSHVSTPLPMSTILLPIHRLGVLLCINGTGILNSWIRRNVAPEGISYAEMNRFASIAFPSAVQVSASCLSATEQNECSIIGQIGCGIHGVDFNSA